MTVNMYKQRAKGTDPRVADIPAFMHEFFPEECAAIVDIYCEPPFPGWKDLANHEGLGTKYYFAVGCHPHNAKEYTDECEKVILEAMKHPYVPPHSAVSFVDGY
jgi:TatD DNase family protein